ncbi:MAG: nucleoside-diphosphate kinase, partial [Bacteroidales bacterium]|nr:nucleoside-diphosphate kinase [Methanocorpusculum sp.]MDD3915493.1 nucleoside-diphosphate kinase [Bacteroidales bacterium]
TNPTEANPGTIRGDFALSIGKNVIHAADSPESAAREIGIHFTQAELVSYKKIDESELYE